MEEQKAATPKPILKTKTSGTTPAKTQLKLPPITKNTRNINAHKILTPHTDDGGPGQSDVS